MSGRPFERIETLAKTQDESQEARATLLGILNGDFADAGAAFDDAIGQLVAFQRKEAETWAKSAIETDDAAETTGIAVGIAAVVLALALGYFVSRSLSRTLSDLANRLGSSAATVAATATQISEASTEAFSRVVFPIPRVG